MPPGIRLSSPFSRPRPAKARAMARLFTGRCATSCRSVSLSVMRVIDFLSRRWARGSQENAHQELNRRKRLVAAVLALPRPPGVEDIAVAMRGFLALNARL